ncbi:hypothetical protein F3Y22_tig00116997pilonHSYRG00403 [Hibiscus syriacus]|uniref:Anion-transporting ATPase-like domain-containing protein n=1 Tax=Hibiscus syriacus TaxID=106335 RepID=A0A6A2XED6_HIBSY|nr:hypothetical protein F3Y22_tig00116997pilonHSYRG00403 [Hibiscus syriacus]
MSHYIPKPQNIPSHRITAFFTSVPNTAPFLVRCVATVVDPAARFDEMIIGPQLKYYFLGGKGGVGKTSCAASLADLAGGNLVPIDGLNSPLLALEVMLFVESPQYSMFSRIVIDTAPTGHTLRFLSLPDFLDASIGKIMKFKKKIASATSAIKSVIGKAEERQDVPDKLQLMRKRMIKVRDLFRDSNTTEFVIVTIPSVMAVNESSRLHASLRKEFVPVHKLFVNQILPPSVSDCKFCTTKRKEQMRAIEMIRNDPELANLRIIEAPLVDLEIRGVPALNPISISHSLRRNPSPSPKISVPIAGEIPHNHSRSEIPHNHLEMKNQPPRKFFSASLTLRNKVSLATTIASKLSPAQRKLFEETCFGPWLRVQHPGGDANLTHLWLHTMTSDLPDSIQRGEEEIWFHFPPAYTCFGWKEFCLITGLRFGHDDVGRYTRHITRPSWLSRVFPDESIEKSNLHVDDLKKLFNKKDGFTRMNDVDVVRVCFLLLLYTGFLGREARQPIPQELILLVEDLNAWNLFSWGSYIWKATWTKLSSAFDDRKSLRGDGSKYTLSGFVWAFKIWIFEAFPSMRTYALKTSNDILRAISWKRKRLLDWEDLIPYATINNEVNTPLMRLTPTEAELATDWWQASQCFLDGTNDEQPPLPPLREPSPHPEPSPDRPDYTPLQREPSSIPELRDEVNVLCEEIGTLRDNDGAWRVEVSTLRGEVAALREMVVSLQNEVHTLRNERPDKVDALRRVFLARQSSRIRRRARAIKSPYTPIVRRHRKKRPNSPVIPQESTPVVEEAPIIPRESPPTVQEATVIVEEVPPTIQEPDSHDVICKILEKPSDVPDMMDESWLSYELPASTIPNQRDESFALGNGQAKLYPAWWEVDKVFIPVLERKHWLLVELQLPSLKAIKPKKLNITVSRDETAPQQTKGPRGDCGPLVCLALERLITGSIKYLPPTDRDRAAVGLWFRLISEVSCVKMMYGCKR